MRFQGTHTAERVRLDAKEHFILSNFLSRLPIYAAMWAFCALFSIMFSHAPWEQPVSDYAGMRAFSVAFVTIATTTITFAIPTCMRAIFSTYEQYYSTKISEILLRRFPVTLLTLSAFTSLITSIAIVSGVIGIAVPVSPSIAFYTALFWTLVCVFYLFVAIEKMVYFVAHAPYAVIEKLEYGVGEIPQISGRTEYRQFRQELASMNDIASTIINKSTGYDTSVTEILEAFKQIHVHYLSTASKGTPEQFKYHMNACRAVDHEIVRIFRIACSAKNEQACIHIIETYCAMLSDALAIDTGIGYFSDMMEQVARFQSYAAASNVDEIKIVSSVNWFFLLAQIPMTSQSDHQAKLSIIVRTMTSILRAATENGDDAIIVKFLRIASNSEIEFDISQMSPQWRVMLDRTVFIYATWLADLMPVHADRYMEYINRYSFMDHGLFRSVLPDDIQRVDDLLLYENILRIKEAESQIIGSAQISEGRTAMILSLDLNATAAHTMVIAAILDRNEIPYSAMEEHGRLGRVFAKEIAYIRRNIDSEEMEQRVNLVSLIDKDLRTHILEVPENE